MITLSSLRRPLETPAPRTSRTVVTAVIGAASITAALALAAPSAQAAAPHANSLRTTVGRTVSPAVDVWESVALFYDEGDCLDAGLAYKESGEALDYRCAEVQACPTAYILQLLVNKEDAAAVAGLPARFSAVRPAC